MNENTCIASYQRHVLNTMHMDTSELFDVSEGIEFFNMTKRKMLHLMHRLLLLVMQFTMQLQHHISKTFLFLYTSSIFLHARTYSTGRHNVIYYHVTPGLHYSYCLEVKCLVCIVSTLNARHYFNFVRRHFLNFLVLFLPTVISQGNFKF